MAFDYSKLNGKIREVCGTQEQFAREIGISRVSLSKRINSRVEFTQDEMIKACSVLHIDKADIPDYFFAIKV